MAEKKRTPSSNTHCDFVWLWVSQIEKEKSFEEEFLKKISESLDFLKSNVKPLFEEAGGKKETLSLYINKAKDAIKISALEFLAKSSPAPSSLPSRAESPPNSNRPSRDEPPKNSRNEIENKVEIEALQRELSQALSQADFSKSESQKAQQKLEKITKDLEIASLGLQKSEEACRVLQKEKSELESQFKGAIQLKLGLEEEANQIRRELKDNKRQLQIATDKLKKMEETERMLTETKERLNGLEEELQKSKTTEASLRNEADRFQEELTSFKREFDEQRNEMDSLRNGNREKDREIEDHKMVVESLKSQAEEEIRKKDDEIEELQRDLKREKLIKSQFEIELERLRNSKREEEERSVHLEEEKRKESSEFRGEMDQNYSHLREPSLIQREIQLKEVESLKELNARLVREVESKTELIRKQENLIEDLRGEKRRFLPSSSREYEEMRRSQNDQEEIDRFQHENGELTREIEVRGQLEQERREKDILVMENERLKGDLRGSYAQKSPKGTGRSVPLDSWNEDKDQEFPMEEHQRNNELEREMRRLKVAERDYENRIEELAQQISRMEEERRMNGETRGIEALRNDILEKNDKIKELEKEISCLNSKMNELEFQKAEEKKELRAELEEKISELIAEKEDHNQYSNQIRPSK